ncbi:MAG: Nitrogen assimilation regulatory protein [Pseudomonadota bacterium]
MNTATIAEPQGVSPPAFAPARAAVPRRAVFVDPASQHLLALAQRVAAADVTTLLVGPTGAGKEVMARVLHESSARRAGPFVAINCAVLPEQLVESQLFGHDKGAFTGAQRAHKGLFEQAEGGTLFLDEIGEMPFHLQAKLLRVLQERQVTRLGSETPVAVNVRLVAATNRDLRQAIAQREFREDLYYRIATFRLRVLPLAERTGDILPLAMQFVSQHRCPGQQWELTPQAQQMLLQYAWPGNVRELENVMRRAVVISPDGVVGPAQLMFDDWLDAGESAALPGSLATPVQFAAAAPVPGFAPGAAGPGAEPDTDDAGLPGETPLPADLHSAVRHNEHKIILATLAATSSRNEAAQRLGISPRTLRYKLAQLRAQGLPAPADFQGSVA